MELDAWVGQGSNDCTQPVARTGTAPLCARVYRAIAQSAVQQANVRTQDIAAVENALYGDGLGRGTADNCSPTARGSTPDPITVYFMLFPGGSASPVSTVVWYTAIDLVAPAPPTGIVPTSRNGALDVRWTPNDDPDVAGYQVFCDSSATPSGCSSSVLVPGQPTTSEFIAKSVCAVVLGRDSHAVTMALPNGQRTAVSVASVDAVGNVGRLSELACETPKADAPEASPQPAGCGSKGICSVSHAPSGRGGLACAALVAMCAAVRRRSRNRKPNCR
jgi:hypothetical protein